MKNIIGGLTLLGLLSAPGFAGGAGTSSAKFLKADSGARASAMGGAFTAVADDADAVNYNPAGMVFARRDQIYFTHNEWISGFKQENLSFVHNAGKRGAFGAGVVYFHSGDIDSTDMSGSYTGDKFSQSDMAASLNYGYRYNDKLSLGAGLKVIRESLHSHSAMSAALDAGALYTMGDWRFGAAIRNLGPGLKLYEESFPLPFTIRGGAAYFMDSALVSAEFEKARDAGLVLKFGGEYRIAFRQTDELALRLGYSGGRDEDTGSGFTGGIGFKVSNYVFDYSFSPFGELGNAHRLSFGMEFGKRAQTAAAQRVKTGRTVPAQAGTHSDAAGDDKGVSLEEAAEAEQHEAEEGVEVYEEGAEPEQSDETREDCVSRCVTSGTLDSSGCIAECGKLPQ